MPRRIITLPEYTGAAEGFIFLAGERVLPGIYREVETRRELELVSEDYLPATLDGRVACYMRINPPMPDGKEPDGTAG